MLEFLKKIENVKILEKSHLKVIKGEGAGPPCHDFGSSSNNNNKCQHY